MTDEELTALIDALDQYDGPRVRAAIELARDPEVGPRLVARLGSMLRDDRQEADRLARLALAVVVVEADAAGAFDALFDHAVTEGGGNFSDEVYEYVLNRTGDRVVRAALDRLPTERDLDARGMLYTFLQTAHGRDPALVADAVAACHARWAIERVVEPEDGRGDEAGSGWTPAVSLCYALAVLGDASVREMIAAELARPRRKGQGKSWTLAAEYAAKRLGENPFDAMRAARAERLAENRATIRAEAEAATEGEEADGAAAVDLAFAAADEAAETDDLDWRHDWAAQMPRWAKVYDPVEQEASFARMKAQMAPLMDLLEKFRGTTGVDNLSYDDDDDDDDGYDDDGYDDRPPARDLFAEQVTMPIKAERKVGRNEPCPCGSGKKYKRCHGVAGGGA